ncbi:MAG TPA: DUF3108 domain-containing protein [Gemmatimonadaceae bacterium]|nr:DUF3108 domain-containing protein [Gemmatimonadaceae bacterium]
MNPIVTKLLPALLVLAGFSGQSTAPERADVPFGIGERMTYEVKFSAISVGSGTMEVMGLDTVRGREAYHTAFRVKGGTFFYKVDDVFESWIATDDLSSLRFHKDQKEGSRNTKDRYEMYPDRRTYDDLLDDQGELPSVAKPLDDGSFLYFVRSVPLVTGRTYEFSRYFKPDRNPVIIRVLRRERVKVPAGEFDAVVVQPVIKARGIFSENGRAEVWLSDDDRRIMLQMKSRLSIGSLNLYLKSYQAPTDTVATP